MHQLVVAMLLIPITITASSVCRAQVGGADLESLPYTSFSKHIVLEGLHEITPKAASTVASSLGLILKAPESFAPSAIAVSLADDGKLGDNAHFGILHINLFSKGKPTDAQMRQLWEEARSQLESELNRITGEVAKGQERRLEDELQRLHRTQHSESDVTDLIEQLAELQAKSAGAEGNFSQGLAEAYSKQRELKLRDAGLQARRQAIELRIDELRKVADGSAAKDPVLAELEKLVEIRRRQLEAVRALHATASKGGSAFQVAEAEGVLAAALVEWTKAKQDAAERAGGGHLRALNDELSKLLIEAAEVEGQRKELEQIIADIRNNVRDMALAMGEAENLKAKIQSLRGRLAEEDARINDLRREYEQLGPQPVTLRPLTVDKSDPSEPEASAPGASE